MRKDLILRIPLQKQKPWALVRGASFLVILFACFSAAGFCDEFSSLVIPEPPESSLVEIEDSSALLSNKQISQVYSSQMDPDSLEGFYAKHLAGLGFKHRKDKEIRKRDSRRLRFDKNDLVVDITIIDLEDGSTLISVSKILASSITVDTKDLADVSLKVPITLPKLPKEEPKFKPVPFRPDDEEESAQRASDSGELDIPAPPKGELMDSNPPPVLAGEGAKGRFYNSDSTMQEVEKFYRQFFRKQGFTDRKDKGFSMMHIKRLRFEGKASAAEIYLLIKEKGCGVGIIEYPTKDGAAPLEKDPLKEISFPVEDAPGDDLANVPRPPESSRCLVRSANGAEFRGYIARISPEEVKQFYLRRMPQLNWELEKDLDIRKELEAHRKEVERDKLVRQVKVGSVDMSAIAADSHTLDFKSNGSTARIMIYRSFLEKNPGSMVNIVYAEAGG